MTPPPQRPLILRAILDDLPLKVVSMVIALTLFVIVRSDKDATTGAYVKVIYTLPTDRVLTSEPVGEVRVTVRGPWTRLSHFDERAIEPIRVDLKDTHDGTVRFDESMLKLPVGLRVASITPPEVKLEFEPRAVKELPIQPMLDGQPAEGYRVTKTSASPSTVHVEGARSAVEAMTHAPTRPIKVEGAHAPVVGEVILEPAPRHTRFIDGGQVLVHVEVQPAMVERTFDALPLKILGLSRMAGQVEPDTARLILRGPSNLVLGIKPEELSLAVDGTLVDTRPPARFIRSVTVNGLPAGVAAEVQPDTVMLSTHRKRD